MITSLNVDLLHGASSSSGERGVITCLALQLMKGDTRGMRQNDLHLPKRELVPNRWEGQGKRSVDLLLEMKGEVSPELRNRV